MPGRYRLKPITHTDTCRASSLDPNPARKLQSPVLSALSAQRRLRVMADNETETILRHSPHLGRPIRPGSKGHCRWNYSRFTPHGAVFPSTCSEPRAPTSGMPTVHRYIDYWIGHGSLLFGHGDRELIRVARDQFKRRATHYGACHELEVRWAELICEMVPCAERVRFTMTGTEAASLAFSFGSRRYRQGQNHQVQRPFPRVA